MSRSPTPATTALDAPAHRAWLRFLPARLAGAELPALIGGAVAAFGLLAFAGLASLAGGDPRAFDRGLLLALRNPADRTDPLGPPWLEETGRDFTALGSTGVLTFVTLGAVLFLLMVGKRAAALAAFLAVAGGTLMVHLLKLGFERPRPDLVPHGQVVYTASFPSGHAALSAVTYLTLGALLARVQPQRRVKLFLIGAAALLTMLVGASRVYLGVHWPTDVLAGWAIGLAWASLCWLVMLALQGRGRVEEDAPGGAGLVGPLGASPAREAGRTKI